MKRPSVPDAIHRTVEKQSREYEDWYQTLERILEQDAGLEIESHNAEVKA